MIRFCLALLPGIIIFLSCGKSTAPESLNGTKSSAGYRIVGRFQTAGRAQDVEVADTLAYIAQGEGGLMIVDIKDRKAPLAVSQTIEGIRGYCTKLVRKDTTIYLAAGTFGVNVVNASDPKNPVVTVSNLALKPARNFYIFGKYLFTAISEQGVRISEISYPTQPDIRGGINTPGYARGVAASADSTFLFVACGEMGFSIFDISDFQEGFGTYPLVGWCDTPGYAEALTVLDEHSVAFLACGTAGLQIMDYSDTSNVHIIGSLDTDGYAKEILYHNNKVYLTTELGGLKIIDVAQVNNPCLIGEIDTEYALGLAMDDHYLYVADEEEGLVIIAIPE